MADRPPWRCRTPEEVAEFKDFIIGELGLRFMLMGAQESELLNSIGSLPSPSDRRRKLPYQRKFDEVELAAKSVTLIREIFEDYWGEGRKGGRLYRGHDPSVEEMAEEFAGISAAKIKNRIKRGSRRP